MLDNPQYGITFGKKRQGGADMLVKTKYKTKTKLILQHPIQYPPYSNNLIVDTSSSKHFAMPKKLLILKKKRILPSLFNYQMER